MAIAPLQGGLNLGSRPLHFGKGKERFSDASAALERQLQAKGITRETLQQEWGVTLWTLRSLPKNQKIRLKLEAGKGFSEKAFVAWLQKQLGVKVDIDVKQKPVKSCCEKPCEGCLYGNKSKRKTWIG